MNYHIITFIIFLTNNPFGYLIERNFIPYEIPEYLDWRTKGVLNPVTNQDRCGSCWAHSFVSTIESTIAIQNNYLPKLSIDYLVNCDYYDSGCDGGMIFNTYRFAKMGLCSDYSDISSCHQCTKKVVVNKITQMTTEFDMMVYLQNYTLLAEIDSSAFDNYYLGIIDNNCTSNTNHIVNIVGYGGTGKNKYWIARNSYGTIFGEGGYFRIVRGVNKCGIESIVVAFDAKILIKDPINKKFISNHDIISAIILCFSYLLIMISITIFIAIKLFYC